MTSSQSANLAPLVSRSAAEDALSDGLRLFVGRGRRYSVKQLSIATGVPERRIEAALYHSDHPEHRSLDLGAVLSITGFLGPDFTNTWLTMAHQGAFELPSDEPDPATLATETTMDTARVVGHAVNGELGETLDEARDLKEVGARMVERGAQLVALGAKRRRAA